MRMRDREELEERFRKASERTDELITKAGKDIAAGTIDALEFKLALSGVLAQRVNVESLLAIAAELLYRSALDKTVRDNMPPDSIDEETELPYVPPKPKRDPEADPDCICPYSEARGRGYDSSCPQHGRDI